VRQSPCKWRRQRADATVYYDFDADTWSASELVEKIDAAAALWTKGTCVTLKRKEAGDTVDNYLLFTRQPGCALPRVTVAGLL